MYKIICICAFALIAATSARPDEKYTTKYDNLDLDQILKSDRLLQNYVNCALDKGPCSPDGTELKKNLPDALKTACAKCSEKQKQGAEKVLKHLIKDKKDWFDALEAKYDPEGAYRKKYDGDLQKVLTKN